MMRYLWCFFVCCLPSFLWAEEALPLAQVLNEQVVEVPVSITLANGRALSRAIPVTIFRPDGPGPFPIAILNHGRNAAARGTPARQRMSGLASFLVRRGFAVFVPTRIGYGSTEAWGFDPEDSGDCTDKNYPLSLAPAIQQITGVLAYARRQPFAQPLRHMVVGQSVGGLVSAAYAATRPSGLLGYINFAGGAGGNPSLRPGEPCQPERLGQLFSDFGAVTQIPSLWIYTENDLFFAPQHARQWFANFSAGGSDAELVVQPPFGGNGHTLLGQNAVRWQGAAQKFLHRLGFAGLSGEAAQFEDDSLIPWVSKETRELTYGRFLAGNFPRAFAVSEDGSVGESSGYADATKRALAACNQKARKPCYMYAVDNAVVWPFERVKR